MEKSRTFEEKLTRLEEISSLMEDSKLTLSESVKFYDEAQILIGELQKELKAASERVKKLAAEKDGNAVLEDFSEEY